MPFCGVISCHEYNTNQPAYPTQSVYAHMMDQWRATKASGIDLYIYEDGIAPSLSCRWGGAVFAVPARLAVWVHPRPSPGARQDV